MKKTIAFFMISWIIAGTTKVLAQKIMCVDTETISGYFYKIKFSRPSPTPENENDVFRKPYFITEEKFSRKTLNKVHFKNKYIMNDTVKFLSYAPDIKSYLINLFDDPNCIGAYQRCVNIDSLISPIHYIKVKHLKKDDQGAMIGLCYFKIKWLHLKVPDRVAFDDFDKPYTLDNPKVKKRFYDIFIPMRVISYNNNIKL